MEECKASVRTWMTVNKLKLNDGKTDIMMVASSHNQCRLTNTHLKTGEVIFKPRPTVKNLGAALNTILSMEAQVISVVWNMYFNIRRNAISPRKLVQRSSMQQSYHKNMLIIIMIIIILITFQLHIAMNICVDFVE